MTSTKLPIWTSAPSSAPGRSRAKGPMMARSPIARAGDMAEGRDLDALADRDAGPEHDEGADDAVAADARVGAEEHRLGRDQRHARLHRARAQAALHRRLGGGEIGAAVDAQQLVGRRLDRRGRAARAARASARRCRSDSIRPWRCRWPMPSSSAKRCRAIDRHQAGIAQRDGALLPACSPRPRRSPSSVPSGAERRAGHRRRDRPGRMPSTTTAAAGARRRSASSAASVAVRDQRRVAIEHQHVAGEARERVARRGDGMAGAELLALDRGLGRRDGRRRRRPCRAPTTTTVRAGRERRRAPPAHARSSAGWRRVQHLGQRGAHPRALAGGKDDGGEWRFGHGLGIMNDLQRYTAMVFAVPRPARLDRAAAAPPKSGRRRARSSVGEHRVHTAGVVGSIPTAPTIPPFPGTPGAESANIRLAPISAWRRPR